MFLPLLFPREHSPPFQPATLPNLTSYLRAGAQVPGQPARGVRVGAVHAQRRQHAQAQAEALQVGVRATGLLPGPRVFSGGAGDDEGVAHAAAPPRLQGVRACARSKPAPPSPVRVYAKCARRVMEALAARCLDTAREC